MSTIFISHSSQDNALAREVGQRLAQQNHHSVFLDFDPEQGIVAGQSWERTLYRKLRACRAVIVLCTDNYLSSQWCFAEIALARMEGKHIIALQANPLSEGAKLPSILTERQFIDLRTNGEDGYRRLWRGLEEQDLLGERGWNPKKPPYLGLSAYQEEHAPVFFGREDESRAGLELVSRGAPGLIMVLGSSGSGKSSLVRAGMLPRLRRENDQWLLVDPFRPGGDPYVELAESLVQTWRRYAPEHAARVGNAEHIRTRLEGWTPPSMTAATVAPQTESSESPPAPDGDQRIARLIQHIEDLRNDPPASLEDRLRNFLDWGLDDLRRITGQPVSSAAPAVAGAENTTPLVDLARELQRDAGRRNARVLLIVDQFEESLGNQGAGHKANRFLGLLRASLEAIQSPLLALGTMRSDFLGLFQHNATLRGIDFESLSLGPMRLDGMRRVIEEPAKLSALGLETGLADRLLEDTETPDALPLLSFTLSVMWRDYRRGGKLEVRDYERLGGLDGAIAGEADALLASARNEGKEEALRGSFLRMARLTEDGGYARQPVAWDADELRPAHPILKRFVERRLLVSRGEGGTRVVEVAHEAMFRAWTPLKTWLDNNRTKLLLLQQIERDAKAWQRSKRAPENLWRGGRLQEAQELARKGQLAEPALAFFRASLRRRQAQRLTLAGIATTVFLALTGLSSWALWNGAKAERQRDVANSGRLASASLMSRMARPDRARLLALEAVHVADTFDARNALLLALQSNSRLKTVLDGGGIVRSVAFAPDGETLVSRSLGRTVRLWRLREAGVTPLREPLAGPQQDVTSVAFAPDGKTLASVSGGTVQLWRLGEVGATPLGEPLAGHQQDVTSVAFAADGKTLASVSGGTVQLWRLGEAGATPLSVPLEGYQKDVTSVAFSPDGKTLALMSSGTVQLWRLGEAGATPLGEPLEGQERTVKGVPFSPDGKTLALVSDGTVRLWRLGEVGATPLGEPLEGPQERVYSVAFAPDGKTLASGSRDGTVRLWRLGQAAGTPLGEPLEGPQERVYSVAFAPDGKTLASGSRDGTVRLWRLGEAGATPLGEPLEGHQKDVTSVAFAPNGKTLASGSGDQTVWLWRLTEAGTTPLGEPLEGHQGVVLSVAFSPDGKTLASGRLDHTVRLWRLGKAGWTPLGEPLERHLSPVASVAFSPDGTTLASGSHDGTVRLWRLTEAGATPLGEPLEGHQNAVTSVAFAPDGKSLVSGGGDQTVRLWRLGEAGATPFGGPLEGHQRAVESVAFAPDGKTLASGSYDGTARLWRLGEAGATPFGEPLEAHQGVVFSVAFSPDGKTLASGSGDQTVRLWHFGIESWKVAACRLSGVNFSLTDWKKYMGTGEPYRCTCPTKGPGDGAPDCP